MQPSTDLNSVSNPSTERSASSAPMVTLSEYVPNLDVLKSYTDSHNCDFEIVSGAKQIVEVTTFKDSYEILLHPSQSSEGISSAGRVSPAALYIPRAKRFSNSLVQVANGITFARHHGIKLLILNQFWYLPKGCIQVDDSLSILNMDGGNSVTNIPGPILSGLFFYQKS